MAEEALKCFTSLQEAVPGMIEELEQVLETSRENQKKIISENQPADQDRDEVEQKVQARKPSISSSLKSRPSMDEEPSEPTPPQNESTPAQQQAPHMTQADALRLAQRKRKTVSICSGRQSGPVKYRSRSLVVVYYDGDVQKRFEALVKNIGVCRNSMRKGKMNAKLDLLSRAGSSGSEDSRDEFGLNSIRRMNGYSSKSWSIPKNDGTPAFDKADGFLDKAQSLCERAAHQVLRDGDCALEVNNAKEHLANAQKVSEAELPGLRKRAEKAAEQRRLDEERKKNMPEEKKADPVVDKVDANGRFGSPATELEVDELEVDDSEEDEEAAAQETVRPLVDTLQLSKFQVRSAGRRSYQLAAPA